MLAPTSTMYDNYMYDFSEQKLVANIEKSRILCGHCGFMCKYDTQLTFEHDRSPL